MVLYGVVRSALQHHSNFSPFIALLSVRQEKDPLFFAGPDTLFYSGVEVIVPSLTALLADTARQVFCDLCPLLGAFFLHEN